MSIRVSLVLVLCATCAVHSAPSATAQDVLLDSPWLSVLKCFQSDSPTSCIQSRAVRALEDLIPQSRSEAEGETEVEETDTDLELEEKLPKGMTPTVSRIIDRLGDYIASGLSQWYPEDPEDLERSGKSVNSVDALDQARGHKKKKKVHKAIKKLVIKFLIFLYVKQQAIRLFMYSAQTFILFKFMLIAGVYVLTNVLKVWTLISWHHHEKHSPKVLYIEPKIKHVTQHHAVVEAPHEHHVHHEDYSPDGYEYEPSPDLDSIWPRSDRHDAQALAYRYYQNQRGQVGQNQQTQQPQHGYNSNSNRRRR